MKMAFLDGNGTVIEESQKLFPMNVRMKWGKRRLRADIPRGTKVIRASCESNNMKSGEGRSFIWLHSASLMLK